MEQKNIKIPKGWTYFVHRSNTERWNENPFELDTINIRRTMSAITERDVYRDIDHFGYRTHVGYTTGKGSPFEIRSLICDLQYLREMDDIVPEKEMMLKCFYFDRKNFGGMQGQRHPSMPTGEELVVIGIGNFDEAYKNEKKIIWTISSRFIDFYKKELLSNGYRIISLESNEKLENDNTINKQFK